MKKEKIKKKRGGSFAFMLLSLVSMAAMLLVYDATGITTFTPKLNQTVLLMSFACIALALIFSIFEWKIGKYATYLIMFWTWLEFIVSEMNYIANVFVSIDGNSFTVGFLLTVAFGGLAWLTALISAVSQKREFGTSRVVRKA